MSRDWSEVKRNQIAAFTLSTGVQTAEPVSTCPNDVVLSTITCPADPRYNDALEQVKTNLRVLLADHMTNGINVRQLQDFYTKRFGSRMNYAFLGYSTFEEFLIDMSDVMCAVRNSTGP
ncbi:hypothetical protein HPB49_024789 [Dermacentor silvarum]|uniref:Uncharacterized protein n=1 Tax=Dermacentor silvarum TaxID=543639 RepID=A0ACB8E4H3_DERSI|nr:hypothetical protein HPB49_024789 [Dermacentor silvarum]